MPNNLIIRHSWLFLDDWQNLPIRVRGEDFSEHRRQLDISREDALREIYAESGMQGIENLATACTYRPYVGVTLVKLDLKTLDLAEWIVTKGGDFTSQEPLTMTISGLLRTLNAQHSTELIEEVLEIGSKAGWGAKKIANFLIMANDNKATWDLAKSCGIEVENAYWSMIYPAFSLRNTEADFKFALGRLLDAGRSRSALQVCRLDLEKVEPMLLIEILERVLQGEEPEIPLIESWYLGEAVESLEDSGVIEKDRLVRLEFGLIPALGEYGEKSARSLYNAIMIEPKLFTELLCIIYKPPNSQHEVPPSEARRTAAEIAWHVMNQCHRQPGTQLDGTIDHNAFVRFIDDARELCRDADRLTVCDLKLGEILAFAPADSNGSWPFKPAQDVLDRPELEDMRRGFQTGVMNKRGFTSRGITEGGNQERELAKTYREYAHLIQNSHIYLSTALEEIARRYENDGVREDIEAKLQLEGD